MVTTTGPHFPVWALADARNAIHCIAQTRPLAPICVPRPDVGAGPTRIDRIRRCLTGALAPTELDIVDEGHKHVGHAGARDGRGHFYVRVVSDHFTGKQPLARHRMVYSALGDLMQTDIHALSVEAKTKEET